jgi:hypothetical protein
MTSNTAQQLLFFTLLVAANILWYNLHNLVDVAHLRKLNQDFGPLAVSFVPSLVSISGHFLPTSEGTNDFIDYLVWPWNADWWNPQGRHSTKAYFMALWNQCIAVVDRLTATYLEQLLNNGIHSLIQMQQNERTVDYHPSSNKRLFEILFIWLCIPLWMGSLRW